MRHVLPNGWTAAATVLFTLLLAACGGGEPEPPPPPPIVLESVKREWSAAAFIGTDRTPRALVESTLADDNGGEFHAEVELGGLNLIPPAEDGVARLEAYSSATGKTYWVGAQAPGGQLNNVNPVGGRTDFHQYQAYRKLSDDATLEFVITQVQLEMIDDNLQGHTEADCPWSTDGTYRACDAAMRAAIDLRFSAFADLENDPNSGLHYETFLMAYDPTVELSGWRGHWTADVDYDWYEFWHEQDFEIDKDYDLNGSGGHAVVRLKRPLVIKVPLDKVPVGREILVRTKLTADAFNYRQRESYVSAFFRDPARTAGVEVRATGLEAAPVRSTELPDTRVDDTPECTGPADPQAGVLQFESAEFVAPELPVGGAGVVITRTGGSRGQVSALFSTRENTAKAGEDFESVTRRVQFRDGEARRTVRVPLLLDGVAELDEALGVELADLRGCAALGAQSTAVLTILDDDRAAPTTQTFSVGGAVVGVVGAGLVLEDRANAVSVAPAGNGSFQFNRAYPINAAYDVRVKQQPAAPAQVCSVVRGSGLVSADVADIEVNCTTPPPTSGLDPSFGLGGKATGDLVAGAKAIARQPDGRIVAGSGTTLMRFLDNGGVDAGFGSGGRVSNVLGGTAGDELFDIAVQPDGRILVAGMARTDPTSAFGYDFGVARFNADGTRDTAFGSGGIVRIDFIGLPDRATRVLVQPDGKLLLIGFATTAYDPTQGTDDSDFAVVRLNADGSLDSAFGNGGRASVNVGGVIDFAYAAALQADGRVVVAGRTSAGRTDESDLGVVRLNVDGSLDASFGAGGRLVLDLSPNWDEAADLAVQADGKIVVAVAWKDVGRFAYGLLRLQADGSRDAGFGTNGFVTTDIGANDDTARALALQADGKIIVAGQASSTTVSDFGLARYLADGSLDAAFGNGGVLRVDFFGALDGANDLLIQPDGKIVVGGLTRNVNRSGTGLVRILP